MFLFLEKTNRTKRRGEPSKQVDGKKIKWGGEEEWKEKNEAKNAYCYKEEWYLEYGNRYNDHGDVHDESEVDYKMMYEALKKR